MPPTMTLDAETRELFNEVKTQLAESNKIKGAVQQLEESVKGVPQTIERKLEAMRRMIYDGRGNYRGICFASEDEARGFGLYVLATVGKDARAIAAMKAEFKDIFERAMGDTPDTIGTPVEYSSRIQRLVEEYGVWASNAFPMPMTGDKLTFQRRTSGLTVFKIGRSQTITASDPKYATVNLNAEKWGALVLYPNELGEDAAVELGELIALEMGQAFAEAIDDCGFVGDGTPASLDVHGITTRLIAINGVDDGGGLVLGTGAGGAGWGSLVIDDFLKLKGRTPRYAQRNGKWYVSSTFFWTVMAKIILAQGGSTSAEIEGRRSLMFLGDQVEITQSMPGTAGNSQVCALYGDLRLSSTHGRRKDMMIKHSQDVKFLEDQTAVLGIQRHAIDNHSLGDANTAGPVLGLITPAA